MKKRRTLFGYGLVFAVHLGSSVVRGSTFRAVSKLTSDVDFIQVD